MRTCVAIDIGRSALKACAAFGENQRVELCYPSAFSKAIRLTDSAAVARAELDTVAIDGTQYFVGETAITQGRDDLISGLTDDWVFGTQHAALFLSALKRLGAQGVPGLDKAIIIVGLPARLHDSQSKEYALSISRFAGQAEIKVIPQSMGPYYQMLFDADGNEVPGFEETSWAMIEVGQFTTDFALVERGAATQHAFGSCDGMRIAAEELQRNIQAEFNVTLPLAEATEMLIHHKLKSYGDYIDVSSNVKKAVEPLAEDIVNHAQKILGQNVRKLDGICLAGGGASLLREAVALKWSKTASGQTIPASFVKVADNPRFAVAEGSVRFAIALEQSRNFAEA